MTRPAGSLSPLAFGRRAPFMRAAATPQAFRLSDDVKLCAVAYAAGFVMVSLFIA